MIDAIHNFIMEYKEIIGYIVLGIGIPVILYMHYITAVYNDERLIKKYGSLDKVPESEKWPPYGW